MALAGLPYAAPQNGTVISDDLDLSQMVVSGTTYWVSAVVLTLYVVSIVYGRLYTAMHSFTDCAVGVVLGASIWGFFELYGEALDYWLKNYGWSGSFFAAAVVRCRFLTRSFC